jgi:hypothetical protein
MRRLCLRAYAVAMGSFPTTARRQIRRLSLACAIGTLFGTLAGCEKPIFTPEEPRSQYDRLDMVRNTREPSYLPDEFGTLRPNLAGRLTKLR